MEIQGNVEVLCAHPVVQVRNCFRKVKDLPKAMWQELAIAKTQPSLGLKTLLSFQNLWKQPYGASPHTAIQSHASPISCGWVGPLLTQPPRLPPGLLPA